MALFNEYPYTNFHEMNLDWVINAIKTLDSEIDTFKALNTITWKGTWNIQSAYPQWSVVDNNGNGYVSIKPVPAGITLDNGEYWSLVANYSALYADFQDRLEKVEKYSWLYNKNVVVYGDSVVAATRTHNYIYKLAERFNMSVTNKAVAGYPIAHSGTTGLCGVDIITNETDISQFDIAFICYGINDWNISVTLSGDSNEYFKNALRESIRHLQTLNKNCRIVCITPVYSSRDFVVLNNHQGNYNAHGYTPENYVNAMIEVCNDLNVLCVDMYHNSNCNEITVDSYMDPGDIKVHPNDALYKIMADIIANAGESAIYNPPSLNNNYICDGEFDSNVTNQEWATIALKDYAGIYFKVPAGQTLTGGMVHTFYGGHYYRLKGYASAGVVITIGSFTVGVVGDFDVKFKLYGREMVNISIRNVSSSVDSIIGGFYLSDYDNEYIGYGQFNNCNPLDNTLNMQVTVPCYSQISDNTLKLSGGYYKVMSQTNAQTKIFGIRNFNIGSAIKFFIAMDVTETKPLLLYLTNTGIYNYFAIPANHVIVINPADIPLFKFYQNT